MIKTMSYLCRKGLNISGTAYKPGDVIPDGVILPNRVRTLKAVGMISEVAENDGTPVVNSQPVVSGSELSQISFPVKGKMGILLWRQHQRKFRRYSHCSR